MNFNKLRYIVTVAEELSVTKAAALLYISQPSLSQCIRSVEEELGVELFFRNKNRLSLTFAGKLYVEWAKATLSSYGELESKLADIRSGLKRQLNVGTTWQRSAILIPPAAKLFYNSVSGCDLRIHEASNFLLRNALVRNEIDIMIGSPNYDADEFVSVPLIEERILLAANKQRNIPFETGNPYRWVSRNVFIDQPVVMLQESQELGRTFRTLLDSIKVTPASVTECYNLETAHKLVQNNIGVALLPELSVYNGRMPDVSYYSFSDCELSRTVAVVYHRNNPNKNDIESFTSSLRQSLQGCALPLNVYK